MAVPFTSLSYSLTRNFTARQKREQGIYFTPTSIIRRSIQAIQRYAMKTGLAIKKVLEPSCGSCEFIQSLNKEMTGLSIKGIEYNETIFDAIDQLAWSPRGNRIKLEKGDYLLTDPDKKYDLIIGNPPYFVLSKSQVNKSYHPYFSGRPNMFILFIVHSLRKLVPGGLLSFVLPKSFINCHYYNRLREFIGQEYKIIYLEDCSQDRYIETQQPTIILIVQNRKADNSKFTLLRGGHTLFNTLKNIVILKDLYKSTTTLKAMGLEVKVGTVVWNQVKGILTNDSSKTRLIYSSDILNGKLVANKYKNVAKKNYIEKKGITGLLLAVNRGYGKGTYAFRYCLIDIAGEYLIENHLICVCSIKTISESLLREKYHQVIHSWSNPKTQTFIETCFGNGALNTKELAEIVPIYL